MNWWIQWEMNEEGKLKSLQPLIHVTKFGSIFQHGCKPLALTMI